MGYLLQNSFIKKIITIPQADVQSMDASNTPFTLVSTNFSFYAVPVLCYIQAANNQTTPYTGFNHLHLTNTGNTTVGDLVGTLSALAIATGDIATGGVYSMLINSQATPNRFGGVNANKDLQIFWDVPITGGDGDLIVTLYYIQFSI